MKKMLIAAAAAAVSAAVYALGPSMYSEPTFSQMERAIAAAKGEGYPTNTPSLYSKPTYSQMERLITAIGSGGGGGGGGADTNSVRTLIDSSFDGGTQKVNRVVGSFDGISNRVEAIEANEPYWDAKQDAIVDYTPTNAVKDIVASSAVTNAGAVVSGNDAEHGTLYRKAEALYDDGMRTVTMKLSPEEYYMDANGVLEKVSVPHGYGYNFGNLVFSDGVGPFDIKIQYAGINDMSSLQCTPHEYSEGLLISSCKNGLTFMHQFDTGYEGDVAHMHTKYTKVTNPVGFYKSYVIAPDGTNYYYCAGDSSGKLYHGTLSSPWDILSSVPKASSVTLSTLATCMRVSPDGTRLFYKGFGTSEMYTALMSTPFDTGTITNTVTTSISSVISGNWYGFCISSDGSYVLLCGTNGLLAKCKLTTPWDMSTMALVQTANTGLKYLRAVDVDEESDMLLVSASALSSAVSPSDVKLYSAKLSGLPECEVFASKPYVDAVRSDIASVHTSIADVAKAQTNYTDTAVKYDVQKVWAQDGSYLHNATGELFSVEVVPMGGVWYFTGMYKSTGLQVTDLPLYYSGSVGYQHSWTNKVGNISIALIYQSEAGTYSMGGYRLVEGLPKNLDPRTKGVVLPDFVQPMHQLWSNVKGEFKAMGSGAPSQTPYDRFATVSELSFLIRKNELGAKFYDLALDGEFLRMCVDIARALGATVTNDVKEAAQP